MDGIVFISSVMISTSKVSVTPFRMNTVNSGVMETLDVEIITALTFHEMPVNYNRRVPERNMFLSGTQASSFTGIAWNVSKI